MFDLKKWIAKVSAELSSLPTFDWSKSNSTDGGYSVRGLSLAGNTYLGQSINLGSVTGRYPIFNGFDISGTGTARIHTLGHYVFRQGGNWYAYIKMRNDNTSAISNFTVTAYITWVRMGGVARRLLIKLISERRWVVC